MADRSIGLVVGSFQFAVGTGISIWPMVKEAVGEWAAELLVEQDKREGDLGALAGEPVGVAFAVTLDQTVGFHFAQIVTELIQSVG